MKLITILLIFLTSFLSIYADQPPNLDSGGLDLDANKGKMESESSNLAAAPPGPGPGVEDSNGNEDQDLKKQLKDLQSAPHENEAPLSAFQKYIRLFNEHRTRQLEAVKSILNFGDERQRYDLINVMLRQLFKTIESAKHNLTAAGYLPGDPFPDNDTVRDYVSKVLENTAMFGDMVLRLPDSVHDIYDREREWQILLAWSYGFCTQSETFKGPNEQLLHLMAQEVGIIPLDPNYVNPFKASYQKQKKQAEVPPVPSKKKDKKKIKRGPRLSRTEL